MPVKSQSAMEYLMTYGWAILIIAVVLSVLFQLGVFSSGNFQPHAQAGSCQVSRTVAGVSMEGQCNGMLPQYVGAFSNSNANTGGFILGPVVPISESPITVTAWIYISGVATIHDSGIVGNDGGSAAEGFQLLMGEDGKLYFNVNGVGIGSPSPMPIKTWNFVSAVYSPSTGYATLYLNGTEYGNPLNLGSGRTLGAPYDMAIGNDAWQEGSGYDSWWGDLSNVQIYNTTLSQPELQAIYQEGIGGAPIRPQNLTAWWPLNGNANDYSGNNYNGAIDGIGANPFTYSSSWESGYTAP